MSSKQRVTVTIDPELVAAGNQAVAAGTAASLSAWVNAALVERARRDEKLKELRAAIADYEQEFGEITTDEMVDQARADREDAVVVRGRRPPRAPSAAPTRRSRSA